MKAEMNEVAYGNILTEVILDSDEWLDAFLRLNR